MKTSSNRSNRQGFTLIELISVVALIAILSTIGVSGYKMVQSRAALKRAEAQMALFENGLERFKSDYGQYPHGGLDLFADVSEIDSTPDT